MPDSTLTYRTRNGKITNATGLNVVFLSYRKQNKVFRNDVVRDILDANDCAVWCDRHLSAGEDFNEEIAAALERMNVFVLMVTPATFEPGCYTLTKEIPRALERKIPIIPILLEETDMKRFAEVLGDIHALDKREPDEYEDELRDRLGKILPTKDEKEKIRMAQKESGSRAAKTIYYQGLGWLTGENCERDPDRGVQMITAAAISGEAPEALLRLAGLYETGDGVTRDWQQALEWYDRYTAAMESRFGENEDDDVSLADAYDSKGKLLKNHGKLTAAKAAFLSCNRVCEKLVFLYGARQERNLSVSYERLGDVCMADGDLTGAKEYYDKSLTIYEKLAKDSEDYLAKRAPTVIYDRLGDMCKAQGDLTGAKEYYLKDLAISERLAADAEGTDAQRDLSVS
ncbi:MAG: TIR domain-containing protein, partial [Clostridia bacterium]|nr:TIR domain-containing protein [Clostridia bacterium]